MTNLNKIIGYYQKFDEWGRLDSYPGQLELRIVLELIAKYIDPPAVIFDLGGGAGRYSYELAQLGYQMHLADLSPDLIAIAKEKLSDFEGKENIKSIQVANALDLAGVQDESFENMLLFGPLYHLTTAAEMDTCLKEASRVLKPKGKIFATYIPYHGGLISILERSLVSPHQVDSENFAKVFEEGVFNNASNAGFQEGNYVKTEVLRERFGAKGFQELEVRSIRGIGYQKEREILRLEKDRPEFFEKVMDILHQTAADTPIVETGGHAVFIGEKV